MYLLLMSIYVVFLPRSALLAAMMWMRKNSFPSSGYLILKCVRVYLLVRIRKSQVLFSFPYLDGRSLGIHKIQCVTRNMERFGLLQILTVSEVLHSLIQSLLLRYCVELNLGFLSP